MNPGEIGSDIASRTEEGANAMGKHDKLQWELIALRDHYEQAGFICFFKGWHTMVAQTEDFCLTRASGGFQLTTKISCLDELDFSATINGRGCGPCTRLSSKAVIEKVDLWIWNVNDYDGILQSARGTK